jgi:hypothetical protein
MARLGWQKSQAEAQKSGQEWMVAAVGDAPALCAESARAIHCWNWCAGWRPQVWPMYATLHPVPDWHLLQDLMEVIRSRV